MGTSHPCPTPMGTPTILYGDYGPYISLLVIVVENAPRDFSLSLVGRFLGYRPSIEMVMKWIAYRWKLRGSLTIATMLGTMYFFGFSNEKDQN